MIQYRQIEFAEAMKMIANDELKNLYFQRGGGIVCIGDYQMDISRLKDKTYFRKEAIK